MRKINQLDKNAAKSKANYVKRYNNFKEKNHEIKKKKNSDDEQAGKVVRKNKKEALIEKQDGGQFLLQL